MIIPIFYSPIRSSTLLIVKTGTKIEHPYAMLFPSLRESAPTVVVQASSNGLLVICLELGGQAQMVTAGCGRTVPAEDQSEEECINGLAAAIEELVRSPELCRQ